MRFLHFKTQLRENLKVTDKEDVEKKSVCNKKIIAIVIVLSPVYCAAYQFIIF